MAEQNQAQPQQRKPEAPKGPPPAAPKDATPATKAPDAATEAKKSKTLITTVKMKGPGDRSVDFPGKRRLQKESFIDDKTGEMSVRLDFLNGETRTVKLRGDLIPKYATHGAEQKLGDEMAGIEDLDDAIEAVDQLIARLNAGEWKTEREAGGMAGTSVLVRALVEYTGKTVEQIRAFLEKKSQTEKTALSASEAPGKDGVSIKAIVTRLQAEKAARAAPVDLGALQSELAAI